MNAVTRKLKSKSGISLAIALVFFLLCAMVGTVVLSAVSVSAGNTARERQLCRETLALTSAASLLSQDIQAMTFIGAYTKSEIVTTTVDPEGGQGTTVETKEEYRPEPDALKLDGSDLFRLDTSGAIPTDDLNLMELYTSKTPLGSTSVTLADVALTFGAVEEQNIPQVTGRLTMGQDYTIKAVLQCGKNTLSISFPPHTTLRTEVTGPAITHPEGNITEKTTDITYTTTLTWGQPLIKEGGAVNGEAP